MQVLRLLEVGEGVVRDQGLPLLQRRGVDRLGEAEPLLADLRDGGDHLLPGEVAPEDGVAAVDVGGDVLEPRPGEGLAERGVGSWVAPPTPRNSRMYAVSGFRHGPILREPERTADAASRPGVPRAPIRSGRQGDSTTASTYRGSSCPSRANASGLAAEAAWKDMPDRRGWPACHVQADTRGAGMKLGLQPRDRKEAHAESETRQCNPHPSHRPHAHRRRPEQSPAMEVLRATARPSPRKIPSGRCPRRRPSPRSRNGGIMSRPWREGPGRSSPGAMLNRSSARPLACVLSLGFKDLFSFPAAGIRVNRPLDRKVLAIQFAEDRRASRDGLNSEVETLPIEGYRHQPLRRQWEREDREPPGARMADAKRPGPSWPGLGRAERYELGTPRQGHRDRRPGVRFPGMSPVHRHAHGRAYPGQGHRHRVQGSRAA